MFTGIIEELGIFRELRSSHETIKLSILCSEIIKDLKIGDSVSVNGVCLTVCSYNSDSFTADVMPETLNRTNLKKLQSGCQVNLERALKLSDRLGGHLVSGHVDGTARLLSKETLVNSILVSFSAPPELLRYIVPKGSVAIDGVSLTVTYADSLTFGVSIIPLTAGLTTIGAREPGSLVNIECDIVAKYIEKFLSFKDASLEPVSRISEDFLKENGFA